MNRKPSERSKSATKSVDLNLIPYMDVVFSLVAFILFTGSMVKIGVVNVNAPHYQDSMSTSSSPPSDEKKKELNLTVGIMYHGFFIAGVGGVLGQAEQTAETDPKEKGPTIPLLQKDPMCAQAIQKKLPAPAHCYNYAKLTQQIIKIKDEFPKETKVMIYAQPDVPYEVLINVMDVTRETEDRPLFFDVILVADIS